MPWTSFWDGDLNGIRQSVWGVPRSKRLARAGTVYALFALFFYMQSNYEGAYTVSIISFTLCLIAALCVNIMEKIPKHVPIILNIIEVSGISYYSVLNGHNEIAYVIGIFASAHIFLVIFDIVPN